MINETEELIELSNEILYILSKWRINSQQQINLLGLNPDYQLQFNTVLPHNSEILERAKALLAIDKNICLVFPHNPDFGRLWITTKSLIFMHRTPLEVMLSDGLPGIMNVLFLLEGKAFS